MNHMDELLKKAFANLDSSDVPLRRKVYGDAKSALERHGKAKNWPQDTLHSRLSELEQAIVRFESSQMTEKAAVTMVEQSNEIKTHSEKPKSGRAVLLGAVALIGAAGLAWFILSNQGSDLVANGPDSATSNPETSASMSEPAQIVKIDFGKPAVANGDAEVTEQDGHLRIADTLADKHALHQWVITGVESEQAHRVRAVFAKRDDYKGWLQMQVYYVTTDGQNRNNVWLLNLANGKLNTALDTPSEAGTVVEDDSKWSLEINAVSPANTKSMQIIILPALGEQPTGSADLHGLSATAVR